MTYTQIGVVAVVAVVLIDLFGFRTKLITRRVFWVSYAIIFIFQLITNGVLTGFRIGRIMFAPFEDLLFGFALVLLTLVMWVWLGRIGVQRTPSAGPPRWRK